MWEKNIDEGLKILNTTKTGLTQQEAEKRLSAPGALAHTGRVQDPVRAAPAARRRHRVKPPAAQRVAPGPPPGGQQEALDAAVLQDGLLGVFAARGTVGCGMDSRRNRRHVPAHLRYTYLRHLDTDAAGKSDRLAD